MIHFFILKNVKFNVFNIIFFCATESNVAFFLKPIIQMKFLKESRVFIFSNASGYLLAYIFSLYQRVAKQPQDVTLTFFKRQDK